MLWRKPPEPYTPLRQGDRGPAVAWLSRQLALFDGAGSGKDAEPVFDAAMVRRVKHFQLSQDLEADGAIGPRTLMRLAGLGDTLAPKLSAAAEK